MSGQCWLGETQQKAVERQILRAPIRGWCVLDLLDASRAANESRLCLSPPGWRQIAARPRHAVADE